MVWSLGLSLVRGHEMNHRVAMEGPWDVIISESLASALWPGEAGARAHARWLAAAMHAGFPRLREEMAFHRCFQKRRAEPAEDARAEAAELLSLLESALRLQPRGGPFLFGEFGAVDAMYAPVAVRLKGFDIPLGPTPLPGAYLDALLDHRAVRLWMDAARALPEPPLSY